MNRFIYPLTTALVLVLFLAYLLVQYHNLNRCGDKSILIYEGQTYCVEAQQSESPPDEYRFNIEPAFTEYIL